MTEEPKIVTGAPSHVERSERWVRARFGGETIADSKRPMLLTQYGPGKLPTYFFPPRAVRMDLLKRAEDAENKRQWTVNAGGKEARAAAWSYKTPPAGLEKLADHITFVWDAMDSWHEEDEEIFVHARDPYKRVDVMASTRHIKVVIAGEVIADTRRPHILFETHLPKRYYLPRVDVRRELLQDSDHTSQCPYKGVAQYWSVQVRDYVAKNIAWSYPDPIPENPKIKGLICFFNERVDTYVDGELEMKPITPWSNP
jgi:uncharacterized protein (DUF427 family)